MGAGNKAMEMAIAQQLMQWREFYPPEAQTRILRSATLAINDNAAEVNLLLPETKQGITDSEQAAMSSIGTLMQGGKYEFAQNLNNVEIVAILLGELQIILQRSQQLGPLVTVQEVLGMEAIAQKAQEMTAQMAQDRTLQKQVKEYDAALGEMSKVIQQMAQDKAQQQQDAGASVAPGGDPKDAAKVQAMLIQAQTKSQIADRSNLQKTQQREKSWAAKQAQSAVTHAERLKQDSEKHALQLDKSILELEAELTAKKLELGHGLTLQQMQAKATDKAEE